MWYKNISKDSDVVISSRIRFARNVKGFKFSNMLSKIELNKIVNIAQTCIDKTDYKLLKLNNIDEITQNSLKEQYLISKEIINNENSAIITNDNNSIVCMINEEDHFRIQAFESGFDVDKCYQKISDFEKILEENVRFSKNEKYGYLTACPTNVGSAMRVSVMLHLPALKKIGMLSEVLDQVTNIGFSVRGIYGENTESLGNIFQISNRKTLGITDKEIISNLKIVISSVIESERKARKLLKEDKKVQDEIYRAYGILKNARIISDREAFELLSKVRLGISLNIIKQIELSSVQSLMIEIQKNTLKLLVKENFSNDEENVIRADYIRKVMI